MKARFLWLDVRATLGERKTLLAAGLMAYAVLIMPVLVAKPPEHVLSALKGWFSTSDPFILFLFIWTDLAMNKIITILGVVLAGSLLIRERETGQLAVLLSKPVSPASYFLARSLSACAVMAVLYIGAHLAAAPLVARSVPGFRTGVFFASMAVHLFSAFFAVCLSALVSVLIQKRALAGLVSLLVLSLLVGLAFMGFYNPAWRELSFFNPITQGISVLGHVDDLRPGHVLAPIAVLLGINTVVLALGALRVRHLEV
ncbi:ABC transporter permease subunit [Archangium sp.]|uniref:ABC transporter permease subunit n=1 Tax=Archangium sp. TaxID=1872627 RepID=UPI002D62083F|nr:ABC transporter permease subunit [Archangium sp.]HYO58540.1 ABC transporter permease subunit [Archangium sp.]